MKDNMIVFAKMVIDQGTVPGLTNADFHKAIQKRAEAIRKAGETAEQAYTRFILNDDEGKLLFKAYRAAPKPALADAAPDQEQDFVQRGPAEQEMREAVERHRADAAALGNKLTYEQGFARVYADPAHLPLKTRYDKETLAAMTKRAAGLR